jgi:hypothetical protein
MIGDTGLLFALEQDDGGELGSSDRTLNVRLSIENALGTAPRQQSDMPHPTQLGDFLAVPRLVSH